MKKLTKADKYALKYFQDYNEESCNHSPLFEIGREIYESIKPKLWEPKKKDYGFDDVDTYKNSPHINTERQCDTRKEAQHRLKNEQILNIINSWISEENEKTGFKVDWINSSQGKYGPAFNYSNNKWDYSIAYSTQQPNQEVCRNSSIIKLLDLLNKGLIKDVPVKLGDD